MNRLGKWLLITLLAVIVISVALNILLEPKFGSDINSENTNTDQDSDSIAFTVNIPANTSDGDIIYLEYFGLEGMTQAKMSETIDDVYTVSIPIENFEKRTGTADATVGKYRYNRNGWGWVTSEYLEPDTLQFYNNDLGREVTLTPGLEENDIIDRWRWFPVGDINNTSNIEPVAEWQARLNDQTFWSGQIVEDLYTKEYDPHFDSLAQKLVDQGYAWAGFAPPWQWQGVDPLPVLGNSYDYGSTDHPNYPTYEKFVEHMKAFTDQGLEAYVLAQICCSEFDNLPVEGRSLEWQQAYADEIEKFHLFHARAAEEARAQAYLFDAYSIPALAEINAVDRMAEMLVKIREIFTGQIGTHVSIFLPDDSPTSQGIIPQVQDITWGDLVDFFVLRAEGSLAEKDDPTDDELKTGAAAIVDEAKVLYETFNKPVVVRTQYYSIKQAWRGPDYYHSGKIPAHETAEDAWESPQTFSGQDQARVVNAYLQAIAERPWVIGYFNFGYTHWEMPLYPDWNTRGKPADDVIRKWNELIYE
ncbi:hypothetical protein ACFL04_02670 [Patescibacteria group bacterium]